MPTRLKAHPALKHGGFSAATILPGEDPAEFRVLLESLIAELSPEGAFEVGIVTEMARLAWRRENLATFRIAELARNHLEKLRSEKLAMVPALISEFNVKDPAACEKANQDAIDEARRDLGDEFELIEIGDTATLDRLQAELNVIERLDTMIDKCLKRLLMVKGLKSLPKGRSILPMPIAALPDPASH